MYQMLNAQVSIIWLAVAIFLSFCGGIVTISIFAINKDDDDCNEALRSDAQRLRLLIDSQQALMPEGGQWWVEGPDGQGVSAFDPREAIDQAAIELMLRKRQQKEAAT